MWFFTYASTRGCVSATRQNSASRVLSQTAQLTWQRFPAVSQRVFFEVGNRTSRVDPSGLYGSSMAVIGAS